MQVHACVCVHVCTYLCVVHAGSVFVHTGDTCLHTWCEGYAVRVGLCVCERMPVCGEPRGPLEGPGPSSQGGESHFWLLSRGVTGSDLASRPTEGAISAWALAAAPRPLAPRPRTRQSSAHKAGSRGCKERGGGAAELGQGDAVGISLGK